eukprot:768381-Hanusia_phi.AAC.2
MIGHVPAALTSHRRPGGGEGRTLRRFSDHGAFSFASASSLLTRTIPAAVGDEVQQRIRDLQVTESDPPPPASFSCWRFPSLPPLPLPLPLPLPMLDSSLPCSNSCALAIAVPEGRARSLQGEEASASQSRGQETRVGDGQHAAHAYRRVDVCRSRRV